MNKLVDFWIYPATVNPERFIYVTAVDAAALVGHRTIDKRLITQIFGNPEAILISHMQGGIEMDQQKNSLS